MSQNLKASTERQPIKYQTKASTEPIFTERAKNILFSGINLNFIKKKKFADKNLYILSPTKHWL